MNTPTQSDQNCMVVGTIGDLIDALYDEIADLPMSDGAKAALVTIMLGDVLKRDGDTFYLMIPIRKNTN